MPSPFPVFAKCPCTGINNPPFAAFVRSSRGITDQLPGQDSEQLRNAECTQTRYRINRGTSVDRVFSDHTMAPARLPFALHFRRKLTSRA